MEFIGECGKVDYTEYYEKFYKIDQSLNKSDETFEIAGAIPFLGSLTSIVRLVMEISVTSIMKSYQWAGIKQDLRVNRDIIILNVAKANIVSSVIQFFPVLGTLYYIHKYHSMHWETESFFPLTVITGHENKPVPLDSLVAHDWRFGGTDQDAIAKASQIYKAKMEEMGGERFLSISERLFVAKQIVNDLSKKSIPYELKEIKLLA